MRRKISLRAGGLRGLRKTPAAFMLAAALILSGCGSGGSGGAGQNAGRLTAAEPELVLTYADNQGDGYPTTLGAQYFASLVKERTGGRIEIEVMVNSEMGDELDVIEQLRFGGVDFTRASIASLADAIPKLNVLQMPYLYRDSDHKWRVLDSEIGDEFMDAFDGSSYVALSWYDAGTRSFYFRRGPVDSLEDMKGMKIRVLDSLLMEDTVRALGAIPVVIPYKDVYSALQTGTVDGAENNLPSYDSMNHRESAPYLTLDNHSQIPEVQLISRSTWDSLSETDRQILRQCARESSVYERRVWAEREEAVSKDLTDKGVTITELSPEELARFRQAVAPLYEKYCAGSMDVIQRIQAMENESAAASGAGTEDP